MVRSRLVSIGIQRATGAVGAGALHLAPPHTNGQSESAVRCPLVCRTAWRIDPARGRSVLALPSVRCDAGYRPLATLRCACVASPAHGAARGRGAVRTGGGGAQSTGASPPAFARG